MASFALPVVLVIFIAFMVATINLDNHKAKISNFRDIPRDVLIVGDNKNPLKSYVFTNYDYGNPLSCFNFIIEDSQQHRIQGHLCVDISKSSFMGNTYTSELIYNSVYFRYPLQVVLSESALHALKDSLVNDLFIHEAKIEDSFLTSGIKNRKYESPF